MRAIVIQLYTDGSNLHDPKTIVEYSYNSEDDRVPSDAYAALDVARTVDDGSKFLLILEPDES